MKHRNIRIAKRFHALDQLAGAVFHLRANGATLAQAVRLVASWRQA